MKKVILACLMAGAMAVTFVSCDTSKDSGSNSETTTVVTTEAFYGPATYCEAEATEETTTTTETEAEETTTETTTTTAVA